MNSTARKANPRTVVTVATVTLLAAALAGAPSVQARPDVAARGARTGYGSGVVVLGYVDAL